MFKYIFIIILIININSLHAVETMIKIFTESNLGKKLDNNYIGLHPDGTNGIDKDLGEFEIPGGPPGGGFLTYFSFIDSNLNVPPERVLSYKDIRGIPKDTKIFMVEHILGNFRSSNEILTIRWLDLPKWIDSAYIYDSAELLYKVNMKENLSITIQQAGIKEFIIRLWYNLNNTSVKDDLDVVTLLFPNPVNNYLSYETKFPISCLYIYSQDGKKVMTDCDNHNSKINVEQLTAGSYYVVFEFPDGRRINRNFIKID